MLIFYNVLFYFRNKKFIKLDPFAVGSVGLRGTGTNYTIREYEKEISRIAG